MPRNGPQFQFDKAKFNELTLYIASRCEPHRLGAIKFNKALYYADMLHYVATGHPITGAPYRRRRLGPTTDKLLFAHRELVADGALEITDVPYYGFIKKEYRARREPDLTRFNAEEIALVDDVIRFVCNDHTATGISELSHNLAWESTSPGDVIPYYTAFLMLQSEVSEAALEAAEREALQLKQRDRTVIPWVIRYSKFFEPAYRRAIPRHARFVEMLDALHYALEQDPRSCGERHPGEVFASKEIWIANLPALVKQPGIVVLYEILDDSGAVILWSVSLLN